MKTSDLRKCPYCGALRSPYYCGNAYFCSRKHYKRYIEKIKEEKAQKNKDSLNEQK